MQVPAPAAVGAVASLISLWVGMWWSRRYRLLVDTPTSKAAAVFVGHVELAGAAESGAPLRAPLTDEACVYYSHKIEEHWSRIVVERETGDDGKMRTRISRESGWKTLAEGEERSDFYVQDETGAVLVRVRGASLAPRTLVKEQCGRGHPLYYGKGPPDEVPDSDGKRRFTEMAIPVHARVFVAGHARERPDRVAPMIAEHADQEFFEISCHDEDNLILRYNLWSWAWLALGMAALLGGWWLSEPNPHHPHVPPRLAGLGSLYLAIASIGWTWMAYNSLVHLRQRVRQGWSLIDVQLKRRHDLIPNLVAAVEAAAGHEQAVQTAVATLRTQLAGSAHEGMARTLRAAVEAHPPLAAQAAFAALHRELVSTEERIALARDYYNGIVTAYRTRLETVPEGWLAWLVGLRPEALLQDTSFERAPATTNFSA